MRLIDAETLKESSQVLEVTDGRWRTSVYAVLATDIDLAPTIETAPVVRCKQCVHSKWSEKNKKYYCQRRWAMHGVRERDFCSYGKRRDEA